MANLHKIDQVAELQQYFEKQEAIKRTISIDPYQSSDNLKLLCNVLLYAPRVKCNTNSNNCRDVMLLPTNIK